MLEIIGLTFLFLTGVFLCGYSLLLGYILAVFTNFKKDWDSYLLVTLLFLSGCWLLQIVSNSTTITITKG